MKELNKLLQPEKWILSSQVKVIVGYNKSLIYDFRKMKAYQISQFMGSFLNKIFTKQEARGLAFEKWVAKHKHELSNQFVHRFIKYIEKLKKLEVLICSDEYRYEKTLIPELEIDFPFKPYLCNLELTSRCNFHCPHCYLGDKSSPRDLDFKIIYRILDQAKELGIQKVHLTGGEIFTREDVGEIIRRAYDIGLKIEISTNGSLLSNDLIDIIEKYVTSIQITIYGLTPEVYSKFSSDSDISNKIISNINKLRKRNPSIVQLAFTLTPYNYQEIDKFYQFAEEKGLKHKIGKTLPIGLALREEKALSEPRYNTFLEGIEEKYVKKTGALFRARACPSDMTTILNDGRVTICSLARDSKFTLGNVYNSTLRTIWYERIIPFLKSLHVDNLEICKDCELKYLCGGGCPVLHWQPLQNKYPPCKIYHTRKYLLRTCEF